MSHRRGSLLSCKCETGTGVVEKNVPLSQPGPARGNAPRAQY